MSKVSFRISSGLKDIIGREMITNDFVAIFELVKNSYDARATRVKVVFELEKPETAAIYIVDNGKGMSRSDIEKKWLFLAYSAKRDGEEDSDPERVYAGRKGIGRFSCDRLGRVLDLQSKTAEELDVNTVHVDWSSFEKDSKKEFEDIKVDFETGKQFDVPVFSNRNNMPHGTVLAITSLRDYASWDRDKLLRLKRALQKLLDPFSGSLYHRELELICRRETKADRRENTNEKKVNGVVQNDIFERIFGKSTVVHSELAETKCETSLTDRGLPIYRIAEDVRTKFPELARCKVSCDIAYLNTGSKSMFHRTMGVRAVSYGSVFLVHNGFRVYPIGEEWDDFWGINHRKQQGYKRYLGTRELLGCVHVNDDGDLFQESSNREGFVITPIVETLQDFVLSVIKKLEAYVTRVTWKDPADNDSLTPERMSESETRARIIKLIGDLSLSRNVKILDFNKNLISILDARSESFGSSLDSLRKLAVKSGDRQLLEEVEIAERKLQTAEKQLDEQKSQTQEEQRARQTAETMATAAKAEARRHETAYTEEVKRNLFLLADAPRDKEFLESFLHQIIMYATDGAEAVNNFERFDEKSTEHMDELCSKIRYLFEKIYSAAQFATSAGFRLSAESITEDLPLFIAQYAEKICMGYDASMKIVPTLPAKGFVKQFNPMEIGLIIENLASNSRKAHASAMSIDMSVSSNGQELVVVFSDDGDGLAPDVPADRIFEKGFSRTDGSGLGLYTCKWVAEQMGAAFELTNDGRNGHKTEFTMRIKK